MEIIHQREKHYIIVLLLKMYEKFLPGVSSLSCYIREGTDLKKQTQSFTSVMFLVLTPFFNKHQKQCLDS